MKKHLALLLLLAAAVVFAACGGDPASNSNSSGNTTAVANSENVGPTTTAPANPNDTPTEAYKRLFAAVKNKNTEAIKAEFSKNSIAAAQSQAARANVPIEEVYKNGFTATTFADKLPEIRDERTNGDMGAVEVWNARDKMWEDLPFIRERSGWKIAVGDALAGNWKRPGPGRAAREQIAANAVAPKTTVVNAMKNANMGPANSRPANSSTTNPK